MYHQLCRVHTSLAFVLSPALGNCACIVCDGHAAHTQAAAAAQRLWQWLAVVVAWDPEFLPGQKHGKLACFYMLLSSALVNKH